MLTRRPTDQRAMPFRSALEWLMQEPTLDTGKLSQGAITPSIDVRETDDALVIEAEMPGIKPEEVEVTLDGRTLSIRARHVEERERDGENGRYLVRERQLASYARVIMLPIEVDPNQVESSFENGELILTIPKAAQSRSRRIPIQGSKKAVGPGSSGQKEASTRQTGPSSATNENRRQPATSGSSASGKSSAPSNSSAGRERETVAAGASSPSDSTASASGTPSHR
jgi:HSP20 family protein